MRYFARLAPDAGQILVTFPDVPEAVTGGGSETEALANAAEALELALLTYAGDGKKLPVAQARPEDGNSYRAVSVPGEVVAKLALIEAFRESGMTKVTLARALGKAENEVRRMLDPYHRTKFAAIEAGLRALGRRLVVDVEAA